MNDIESYINISIYQPESTNQNKSIYKLVNKIVHIFYNIDT